MCRLFGFRSNSPARVHQSLLHAKNSLRQQSLEHRDGWGIASYPAFGDPDVAHGIGPAHSDPEFERVSGLAWSHAVLAHVRLASVGPVVLRNTHPFTFGRWTFAHNGTVRDFDSHRATLEAEIDPDLRGCIRGDTESERCFYLFLTYLRGEAWPARAPGAEATARALCRVAQLASRLTRNTKQPKPTSLNLIVTDGRVMAATRRHRTLFFSDGVRRESAAHREPGDGMRLPQLVLASEELSGEDHWHEVPEEGVVAVEEDLTLRKWTIGQLAPL